ncbi:MAG: acyltransferase, partial [Thermoanaerobaculia bacterium]|nr:acyltransferase [Thermoanaerobaculia bacterium]
MSGIQAALVRQFSLAEARSLRRNFGLDIVRAIAILLVLSCHSLNFVPPPHSKLYYYGGGFLGVELFFVLSGYLIGSILLKIVLEKNGGKSLAKRIGEFWIRRWFRTLPNYYLFLLVNFFILSAGFSKLGLISEYFYFGQNLISPIGVFMNESWSLAVEEWFYLSFPVALGLLVLILGRSRRTFIVGTLMYILVFSWLRSSTIQAGIYGHWDQEIRKIVVLRLDAIAYGALIMALMSARPVLLQRLSKALFVVGIAGVGLVLYRLDQVFTNELPATLPGSFFSLTNVSLALLLPFSVYQTRSSGRSRLRTCIAWISILSYSMYLLHLNMIRLVQAFFSQRYWLTQFILYWVLCFSLSYLVYVLYERRMTALREKLARSHPET